MSSQKQIMISMKSLLFTSDLNLGIPSLMSDPDVNLRIPTLISEYQL